MSKKTRNGNRTTTSHEKRDFQSVPHTVVGVDLSNVDSVSYVVDINNTKKEKIKENELTVGVVANCKKLNIRKNPDIGSEILTVVSEGEELTVTNQALDNWLAVETKNGVSGYCMKTYLTVNK